MNTTGISRLVEYTELNTKRRKLLGSIVVVGLLPACGGGARSKNDYLLAPSPPPQSGGPVVEPALIQPIPSLSALTGPIYVAHRGSAALYPEETFIAYDASVSDGQLLLEGDVQTLADGALAVIHDETVDRTTTGTGTVASYTQQRWKDLRVDGDNWHGSHFGNDLATVLFADWVRRYKGKSILVPEDKDERSMRAMLAILVEEGVRPEQVLLQSFGVNALTLAVAAGYSACLLAYSGGPQQAIAAGVRWGGVSSAQTDAEVREWVASGLNVLVWTVNRRFERDLKLALGVKGFFSDDPSYLSRKNPLSTTDRFNSGTWAPGMLAGVGGDFNPISRGKFFGDGYWGYDHAHAGFAGCLQGYLCPIKGQVGPVGYSISVSIKFGAAIDNDTTRWASLFIGIDDRPFVDSNESTAGYHVLFRRNGAVEIFKKTPGAHASLLAATPGQPFTEGEEGVFRVTVSDGAIAASRMNRDGTEKYTTMANDPSYRGAYLHLGRSGLACSFRRVSIT